MSNARQLAQAATLSLNFRNRIRNGSMRIDQRSNGAAVSGQSCYVADGWSMAFTGTNLVASMQRVAEGPPGMTFSAKTTITTVRGAIAAADAAYCYQPVEGLNLQDFAYGTASAKTSTLSFWVRSSVVGNYAGFLRGQLGTGPTTNRSYIFLYTVNAANTWEYKTITVPGDTAGAFNLDNTAALGVLFDLGSGSAAEAPSANTWLTGNFYRVAGAVNICNTLNATWQVTGVQLELGAVATPFELRPIQTELTICMRYFEIADFVLSTAVSFAVSNFKVPKRVPPTLLLYGQGGTGGTIAQQGPGSWFQNTANSVVSGANVSGNAEI